MVFLKFWEESETQTVRCWSPDCKPSLTDGRQKISRIVDVLSYYNGYSMGILDFELQQTSTLIMCTTRMWEKDGIWAA